MRRPARQATTPGEAELVYRRFLAAWAADVLALRRAGLDRPGWRAGAGRPSVVRDLKPAFQAMGA